MNDAQAARELVAAARELTAAAPRFTELWRGIDIGDQFKDGRKRMIKIDKNHAVDIKQRETYRDDGAGGTRYVTL